MHVRVFADVAATKAAEGVARQEVGGDCPLDPARESKFIQMPAARPVELGT